MAAGFISIARLGKQPGKHTASLSTRLANQANTVLGQLNALACQGMHDGIDGVRTPSIRRPPSLIHWDTDKSALAADTTQLGQLARRGDRPARLTMVKKS